jgi:beta-L-arabinofuranosidase (glycosyl hydrolase family 127)
MTCGPVDLDRSPSAALHPLAAGSAEIDGGFWADRQRLNRDVLLPDGRRRLEEAGNLENLRRAARGERGGFRGMVFADSDVHKWLEAAGWELQREPSDALAASADQLVALLGEAQRDDGYLDSYFQLTAEPAERFTRLAWDHELYCAGHLIQAGVAHARGRGDETLHATPAASPTTSTACSARAAGAARPATRRSRPPSSSSSGSPASGGTSRSRRSSSTSAATACFGPRRSARATSPTTSPFASSARSQATPCARSTWPPASPTSTSRPASARCSTSWRRSGRT